MPSEAMYRPRRPLLKPVPGRAAGRGKALTTLTRSGTIATVGRENMRWGLGEQEMREQGIRALEKDDSANSAPGAPFLSAQDMSDSVWDQPGDFVTTTRGGRNHVS